MSAGDETTLVIVGGPPASGKSTLAQQLSGELRIPVFSKDDFKEALFDSIGYRDREGSRSLGKASHELLVMCARKLVANADSCILESTFRLSDAALFEEMRHTHSARIVQVFCHAPLDELRERFRQRVLSGRRHPGHYDDSNDEELVRLIETGEFAPLDVRGDLIRVNTGAACQSEFRSNVQRILSCFA